MSRSGDFLPLITLSILAVYAFGIYISHQRWLKKKAAAKAATDRANANTAFKKAA